VVPGAARGIHTSQIAVMARRRFSASFSTPVSVDVAEASQLQAVAIVAAESKSWLTSFSLHLGG
jgi:hypothetical protein